MISPAKITKSIVEETALEWFEALGYEAVDSCKRARGTRP